MFTVISIFFGGILLGYLLKNLPILQRLGKSIFFTILLLLFLLGISLGSNENIVSNLASLGSQAVLISFAGILGSVLAAQAVYHFFFRKGGKA